MKLIPLPLAWHAVLTLVLFMALSPLLALTVSAAAPKVKIIPSGVKSISGCRAKPVSVVFNSIVSRAANGSAVAFKLHRLTSDQKSLAVVKSEGVKASSIADCARAATATSDAFEYADGTCSLLKLRPLSCTVAGDNYVYVREGFVGDVMLPENITLEANGLTYKVMYLKPIYQAWIDDETTILEGLYPTGEDIALYLTDGTVKTGATSHLDLERCKSNDPRGMKAIMLQSSYETKDKFFFINSMCGMTNVFIALGDVLLSHEGFGCTPFPAMTSECVVTFEVPLDVGLDGVPYDFVSETGDCGGLSVTVTQYTDGGNYTYGMCTETGLSVHFYSGRIAPSELRISGRATSDRQRTGFAIKTVETSG
ncbi:uncharacterized protein LOC108665316 isoform X2 [Hyalella azteca]|uniref:Uncharacterized protein LOC108665316 isoform X2 n=1 Tax=Hyalella azteca TaxID=294128 RepID=A0A8B7N2V3_HYAAZ|nr:uncharacterized protein LOC108665316 isoform X2 [Hyalella azteca]